MRCRTPAIRCAVFVLFVLALQVAVGAQAPSTPSLNPSAAERAICKAAGVLDRCGTLFTEFKYFHNAQEPGASLSALEPWLDTQVYANDHAQAAFLRFVKGKYEQFLLQSISTRAAVTQAGADAGASTGSTNLVSKPTTTDFLSIASESGAFTDTQNATSVTLQANANGLAKLFTNHEIFAVEQPSWSSALQPLNFTVSLNVAQSNNEANVPVAGSNLGSTVRNITLPANNASFSAFSARYNIYRPFDPTDRHFQDALVQTITASRPEYQVYTDQIAALLQAKFKVIPLDPAYARALQSWRSAAAAAEQRSDDEAFTTFVAAYKTYADAVDRVIMQLPDIDQTILALNSAVQGLQTVTDAVMAKARGTALATITYTYATPPQQPATHQFGVVGGYLFRGGHKDPVSGDTTGRTFSSGAQINLNFAATLFADQPSIVTNGRLRDFQASAEFDKPFGGTSDDPRATWSVAGYGQYQYDPTVLNITSGNLAPGTNITLPENAQVLLGTAGWLGVVQGKLTVNLNKGLSLPVALKWSNKTDLLNANDIRGQIGLSYDLSALGKLITGRSGNGQ